MNTQKEIDEIVKKLEENYSNAYSAADPVRLSSLFAADAMVQTQWGPVLLGREEIMKGLVALFRSKTTPDELKNIPIVNKQVSMDVIVSFGQAIRKTTGAQDEKFLYTRVYVFQDERWLLSANQIATPSDRVKPAGIGL